MRRKDFILTLPILVSVLKGCIKNGFKEVIYIDENLFR